MVNNLESLGRVDLSPTLTELLSYIIFNKGFNYDISSTNRVIS